MVLDLMIDRELMRRSYWEFFKGAWGVIEPTTPLVENWHMKVIADELQEALGHVVARKSRPYDVLVINVPPGSTKSTLITMLFPAWAWTVDPSLRFLTGSYSTDLSIPHAIKSRDVLLSEWFQDRWGDTFRMKYDKNKKSEYENDKTGVRMATSVQGVATGKHADVIIIDDPINPKQATSAAMLKIATDWWDHTLSTRLRDKDTGIKIVVMQRLHVNDLTGHILTKSAENKGLKVRHLCFPAEMTRDVTRGYDRFYVDGLFDPRRMSRAVLDTLRVDLGGRGYAGQMLQAPYEEGGNRIKRSWFKVEEGIPQGVRWELFVDGAYTEKTANDPTALMVVGMRGHKMYIRHCEARRMEMPELLAYIPKYCEEHGVRGAINIEPKASGLTMKQMLVAAGMNAIEIRGVAVRQGKIGRADSASPMIEAGRVVLCRGGWNELLLSQVEAFPNGGHDDLVDCLSYSVLKLMGRRRGVRVMN